MRRVLCFVGTHAAVASLAVCCAYGYFRLGGWAASVPVPLWWTAWLAASAILFLLSVSRMEASR